MGKQKPKTIDCEMDTILLIFFTNNQVTSESYYLIINIYQYLDVSKWDCNNLILIRVNFYPHNYAALVSVGTGDG